MISGRTLKALRGVGSTLAGGLAVVGCASGALAADATGTASVQIQQAPLSVVETGEGLRFDTVTPSGAGDTESVSPGNSNSDEFTVTGQPYAVVLMSGPESAGLSGPSGTLQVDQFQFNNVDDSNYATLGSGGTVVVSVGATLTVPGGQAWAPGTYTGQYSITADYQ